LCGGYSHVEWFTVVFYGVLYEVLRGNLDL